MIFESKVSRDSSSPKKKVDHYQKSGAWIFITTLNIGLLVYSFVFALSQTEIRQAAWIQSFVVWLVIEISLASTFTVYVNQFLIPSLAIRELTRVKQVILETFKLYSETSRRSMNLQELEKFNIADYFFASKRISVKYPNLWTSKLISNFRSIWPYKSYQGSSSWWGSAAKLSVVLTLPLKYFLILAPMIQDAIISSIMVVVFGYIISASSELYYINGYMILVPIVCFGLFLCILFMGAKQISATSPSAAKISPLTVHFMTYDLESISSSDHSIASLIETGQMSYSDSDDHNIHIPSFHLSSSDSDDNIDDAYENISADSGSDDDNSTEDELLYADKDTTDYKMAENAEGYISPVSPSVDSQSNHDTWFNIDEIVAKNGISVIPNLNDLLDLPEDFGVDSWDSDNNNKERFLNNLLDEESRKNAQFLLNDYDDIIAATDHLAFINGHIHSTEILDPEEDNTSANMWQLDDNDEIGYSLNKFLETDNFDLDNSDNANDDDDVGVDGDMK